MVSYGTSDPGHVAVVVASTLNSQGTGQYTVIQENIAGEVTLSVTRWRPTGESDLEGHYLPVTGWLHVKPPPTTTVSPQHGFPVDPVCQTHKIAEPDTTITISGSYYKPHDKLFVRSAHVLLGTPVVSAAGGWSLRFTVPTRPDDAREPLTVVDASRTLFTGSFLSGAYACWALSTSAHTVTWDAVGWDAYSPMTFYIDGLQKDFFDAASNGSRPARTFTFACLQGSTHGWEVTGELDGLPPGGLGNVSGTMTCSDKSESQQNQQPAGGVAIIVAGGRG